MGAKQGKSANSSAEASGSSDFDSLPVYKLCKDGPGCTGMFYRPDPRTKAGGRDSNWPRDDALLRGNVIEVNGTKWLECKQVKQSGKSWTNVSDGNFMPFRYSQYFLKPVED